MACNEKIIPEAMVKEVIRLRREGNSKQSIYYKTKISRYIVSKILDKFELGDERYSNKGKEMEFGKRDDFVCGYNCAWCKRQFQWPCPMAVQDSHFEYKMRTMGQTVMVRES